MPSQKRWAIVGKNRQQSSPEKRILLHLATGDPHMTIADAPGCHVRYAANRKRGYY
jgi:hypothetical protein